MLQRRIRCSQIRSSILRIFVLGTSAPSNAMPEFSRCRQGIVERIISNPHAPIDAHTPSKTPSTSPNEACHIIVQRDVEDRSIKAMKCALYEQHNQYMYNRNRRDMSQPHLYSQDSLWSQGMLDFDIP